MKITIKKENVKNTYRKFDNKREEKLFNEAIDFVIEKEMTASEACQIFGLVIRSINNASEDALKNVDVFFSNQCV